MHNYTTHFSSFGNRPPVVFYVNICYVKDGHVYIIERDGTGSERGPAPLDQTKPKHISEASATARKKTSGTRAFNSLPIFTTTAAVSSSAALSSASTIAAFYC